MYTLEEIDTCAYIARGELLDPWLDKFYAYIRPNTEARINYYRFLYHLVRRFKPRLCVELGVEYGGASAHMAKAADQFGGIVVGVDHERKGDQVSRIEAECPNYIFVLSDTIEAAPVVEFICSMYERKIDLVFHDSSHHFAPSIEEFKAYEPLLADETLWVCDDITPAFQEPGVDEYSMVEFFDRLPGEHRLYPHYLHTGNTIGVALIRK